MTTERTPEEEDALSESHWLWTIGLSSYYEHLFVVNESQPNSALYSPRELAELALGEVVISVVRAAMRHPEWAMAWCERWAGTTEPARSSFDRSADKVVEALPISQEVER